MEFQDREVRTQIDIAAEIGIELTFNRPAMVICCRLSAALYRHFTYTEMYSDLLSPGYSSGVPGLIDLAMACCSVKQSYHRLPCRLFLVLSLMPWSGSQMRIRLVGWLRLPQHRQH